MGAPEPVELSWSVEPEALLSAVGAANPVVGAMVRLSDPRRRSTASRPGSLIFLAVFAAAAVYFAVRSDGSAALVACALLALAAVLSFIPHPRSAPDRDRLLREPIQFQLRLDGKGATVVANGSATTRFWPEVTRVRSTSAGLTFTSRVGQSEDLTLVPASAVTPESLRQTKALVDAYAPGRWYDG